jgi:hypothetical protein
MIAEPVFFVVTRDRAGLWQQFACFNAAQNARGLAEFLTRCCRIQADVAELDAGEFRQDVEEGIGNDVSIAWYYAPHGAAR